MSDTDRILAQIETEIDYERGAVEAYWGHSDQTVSVTILRATTLDPTAPGDFLVFRIGGAKSKRAEIQPARNGMISGGRHVDPFDYAAEVARVELARRIRKEG